MCLLVVLSNVHPSAPLIVAANRDEMLARPASPWGVLQDQGPRILGGRDGVAGGTWLGLNEHGVVVGLTNKPTVLPRDPSRRSRGELPLRGAAVRDARSATEALQSLDPNRYHPCWLFAGDRGSLYYVDFTDGEGITVESLGSGVHVLENRPMHAPSPKVDWVRQQLDGVEGLDRKALEAHLQALLASHEIPAGATGAPAAGEDFIRPRETEAACVHAGPYGTRSSSLVWVFSDAGSLPQVQVTEGPPCENPFVDVSHLWNA